MRLSSSRILSIATICAVLTLVSLTFWITSVNPSGAFAPVQSDDVTVSNKTQAFQIISAVRDGETVQLSLKNGYGKAINGFTISSSDTSGVQVDFTPTDEVIAPGGIYHYKTSVASLRSSDSLSDKLTLKILSVVFDDGTSDGDHQAIADIKNRRLGEKIQLARILPLLRQALSSSDADKPTVLARLKSQITLLTVKPDNGQPVEITGGLLHGKEYILREIRALEQEQSEEGSVNLREKINKIKERYERKAARL
jgi:hypothetical protein